MANDDLLKESTLLRIYCLRARIDAIEFFNLRARF